MADLTDPPPPSHPDALRQAAEVLRPLARYHRLEVRGLDRLPAGPALLVGNHNSGAGVTDALFLLPLYERLGFDVPVHVLAHDFLFELPGFPWLAERLGVLRAGREAALRALRAGRRVLVFPGSDKDSMRPWAARRSVIFDGRTGFARLAMEAGVPIVPVASAGAHETWIVLTQGRRMAERVGLQRRLRWSSLPVALSLPWGLTVGPFSYLPYLPLPAKVTVELGAPLDPGDFEDPAALAEAALHALQAQLTALYAERRWPVLG